MSAVAVDTSAIVELLTRGPKEAVIRKKFDDAQLVHVTQVTRVETALVMLGRFGLSRSAFDHAWELLGAVDVTIDAAMAKLAIDAFGAWGKGRHKANLNFGDCFSYALARSQAVPLLFVGNDFAQTDIDPA